MNTCTAESPGGTQAYSSRAHPLSSSEAAEGQLCVARPTTADDTPLAAVDGDLGDRCGDPAARGGAVGEERSSSGGWSADDDGDRQATAVTDGLLQSACAATRSRGLHVGIRAGGCRRAPSPQLFIAAVSILDT